MRWRFPTVSGFPPFAPTVVMMLLFALLYVSAPLAELSLDRILKGVPSLIEFLGHLITSPDWQYLGTLFDKMLETIEMTLLATSIACLLSFPFGILAAKNASPHPAVFRFMRELLSVMRALPELVWALVFVSAVGLGPLPGIMALAFVTVGFLSKFIAESIEVVDDKPLEGIRSTGGNRLQVIMFGMIPQAMPDFVGTLFYILDHNLRAATILGLVGAGGIGYDMVVSMRMFQYDHIIMIAVSIYLIVTLLDRSSDVLRRRIIKGRATHVA